MSSSSSSLSSGPMASLDRRRSYASETAWGPFERRYDLKRSYAEKFAIASTLAQQVALALLCLGLIVLPFVAPSYMVFLASLLLINLLSAAGLHILQGLAGVISIGHAAFMAVGAYTAIVLSKQFGWPMWITLFAGAGATVVAGLLFAWPALRLRGFYATMVTLAASFLVPELVMRARAVTGGGNGITVPKLAFPWGPGGQVELYFVALVAAALAVLAAKNLARTGVGRAMQAIRDRDIAAEVLGVPVVRYKLVAFALSSLLAGLAGGLMAINAGFVTPDAFSLELSIQYLTILIVGGIGSIGGVILGTIFMTMVPDTLQSTMSMASIYWPALASRGSFVNQIVWGLLIVGFVIGAPRGLIGLWQDIRNYFRRWPF